MTTVRKIYDRYEIMPALRLHQIRVAAVAKYICDSLKINIDTASVVEACLFHDMGNIIKADLALFPEFLQPEGKLHWEKVKNEFREKYGNDEHAATLAIDREIGLKPRVIELIENIGFNKMLEIRNRNNLENKIVQYADMRVAPRGVTSVAERLREGKARYASKKNGFDAAKYAELVKALYDIEREILSLSAIKQNDLSEKIVASFANNLELADLPI